MSAQEAMKTTGKNSTGKTHSDKAGDQALAWVARLRSDKVCEADMSAFADWLTQSDSHQAAWEQALDIWETAGVVSHMPVDHLINAADTQYQKRWTLNVNRIMGKWFGGLWRLLATVSASVAIVAIVFVTLQDSSQTYYSDLGEYQQITLQDGSLIELNTDSAISVSLSDSRREIELIKGEAFFTVASDKRRPFVVTLGGASVQALGTAFNIYRHSDKRALVTVTEGVVRVAEVNGSAVAAADTKMLLANQAVAFDETTGFAEVPDSNIPQVIAWRDGQIMFDRASVTEAVTILNRYLEHKIVLADNTASNHRISGIFSSREKAETLRAVAQAFDLELSRPSDNWLLSPPNP